MAVALTLAHLLSAHPATSGVIDAARLQQSSSINLGLSDLGQDISNTEMQKIADAAQRIRCNSEELVSFLKPTTALLQRSIEIIENAVATDYMDEMSSFHDFAHVETKEMALQFFSNQIDLIEANRRELGPFLNEVPRHFIDMSSLLKTAAQSLSAVRLGEIGFIREKLFSISSSIEKGSIALQEACAAQFRYLLLLKMMEGALEADSNNREISSSNEMRDFLSEIWS